MPDLMTALRADQVAARKGGDKDRTLLLGTVLAALKNRELDASGPLPDELVIDVLRKQIKQREDSVRQYTAAARPELAASEQAEIEMLRRYLPPETDPAEIRAAAAAAVAAGAADLGKLMGQLMGQFRGRADGKVINQIAREALGQG
jgi:uncharacterized protein YqeY